MAESVRITKHYHPTLHGYSSDIMGREIRVGTQECVTAFLHPLDALESAKGISGKGWRAVESKMCHCEDGNRLVADYLNQSIRRAQIKEGS